MIETFKYMKGVNKVQEGGIFSLMPGSKTRGHEFKLAGGKFKTNHRKYFFSERVVDGWNRLPAEVVSQSTVSGFKHA